MTTVSPQLLPPLDQVIDEYDDQSEVAERLRIKSVPLFHFYKNGILLEAFATRDKVRIKEAIEKYTVGYFCCSKCMKPLWKHQMYICSST